jgi:hypothetical protein
MANQLTYTVTENGEVIARFESSVDATQFAEMITLDGDRKVLVEDRAGWVTLKYSNGYTLDIR